MEHSYESPDTTKPLTRRRRATEASRYEPTADEFGSRWASLTKRAAVDNAFAEPGRTLSAAERAPFDGLVPVNLDDVRVHRGSSATAAAESVDATAFTVGRHVVLGNSVDTVSDRGRAVLAHELVHVAQRGREPHDTDQLSLSRPADAEERTAHRLSSTLAAGRPVVESVGTTRASVNRQHRGSDAADAPVVLPPIDPVQMTMPQLGDSSRTRTPAGADGAMQLRWPALRSNAQLAIEAYARSVARGGRPVLLIDAAAILTPPPTFTRRVLDAPDAAQRSRFPTPPGLQAVQIQAQYGLAVGTDLLNPQRPTPTHQFVLDVGLVFHGPADPSMPSDSPLGRDPGGFELHTQYQLNSDGSAGWRLSDQYNVQAQIVSAVMSNFQVSGFVQGSAGTGYDQQGQLATMLGASVGGQASRIFVVNNAVQIQLGIQLSAGIQSINQVLQAPAQLAGTATVVFQ